MMVIAVKTLVTPEQVARALRVAWLRLFDAEVADHQLAVLMAQSALETGRWKSCWNFNLGNIKGGGAWAGDTCQFRLNEVIGGVVQWFDPPHPQTTMRAYSTLADGAADYLWLLRRRFARAWDPILRGDPVAFSQTLKSLRYYTAPEEPYTKAVKSLTATYARLLATLGPEAPAPVEAVPTPVEEEDGPFDHLALSIAARHAVDEVRQEAMAEMRDLDTEPPEPPPDTERA